MTDDLRVQQLELMLAERGFCPDCGQRGESAPCASNRHEWPQRLAAERPPRSYLMGLGYDPGWAKHGQAGVVMMPDGKLVSAGVDFHLVEKGKGKEFEKLRVSVDDNRRMKTHYEMACQAIEKLKPDVIGVECYTIYESQEYVKLRDAAAKFLEFLGLAGQLTAASRARAQALNASSDDFAIAIRDGWSDFTRTLNLVRAAVDKFRVVRGRGDAAKTYGVYAAVCCAAFRYNIPTYVFLPMDLKMAACGKRSATKEEVMVALGMKIEGLHEKVHSKIRRAAFHEHVYDAAGHGMLAVQTYARFLREGIHQNGAGAWRDTSDEDDS